MIYQTVREYILSQSSLNVTPNQDAAINDNYIYLIELQQPSKDEALYFLDNENAPKPERTAGVAIYNGGKVNPDVREYLVVPAAKPTQHKETSGPGQTYPIPFDVRPLDSKEEELMDGFIVNVTTQVGDLLRDSYDGYTYADCSERCLTYSSSAPGEKGERKHWVWFMRDLPGFSLHPVGFELYLSTKRSGVTRESGKTLLFQHVFRECS